MCSLIRTFNVHTKIQNSNSNWNSNWNRIWFTSERGLVTHWSNEWMRFFLGRIWMFFRTQHDMEFWQCQNNHGIDGGFIIWSLIILINLTIFWYFFFFKSPKTMNFTHFICKCMFSLSCMMMKKKIISREY